MTHRHFRHFVFFPLSALALIVIVMWISTPFIAKHYISKYFNEQEQDISIGSLSIDFFPPKIDLKNVIIKNATQDTLTLKRALFEIETLPLLTRTVHFSQASIDGLSVWAAQHTNNWIIAGINITQYIQSSETDNTSKTKIPKASHTQWKIILPVFTFTNSQLHLSRQPDISIPAQTDNFTIKKLAVENLSGQALEWKGSVSLSALVNQSNLSINSQFDYSPELINADIKVENTHISIGDLRHFLPVPFETGEGKLAIEGAFQLSQTQVDDVVALNINDLNLKAAFTDIDLPLNDQDKVTTASTTLNLTEGKIESVATDQLIFTGKTALVSNQFAFTQANLIAQYDNLALAFPIYVKHNELGLAAQIANTQLDITNLSVVLDRLIDDNTGKETTEKHLTLNDFKLTSGLLNVEMKKNQAPAFTGENITISTQLMDSMLSDNKRIAAWKSADINTLSFSQQGSNFDVALEQLNMTDLTLSEILTEVENKKTLPALSHIGNLTIATLAANQSGTQISAITTDSVEVNLILGDQKRIENLITLEESPTTLPTTLKSPKTPREKDAENTVKNSPHSAEKLALKAPYYIILDAYDMTGESQFYVQDKSIIPALQRSLDIDTLSLRSLNTQNKDQGTELILKARSGKYAILSSNILIWPLADKLTMKSEVTIQEAELPPYSSYIANALGYQINSGQLNLNLTLNADEGELEGNSHILLREFDLGGKKESNTIVQAGAIPLNIAVGILKDSNNNIDLDIPLSGNIENPEFGWQNFMILPVRKALYSASSTYLLQTFVPYANVISIAQYAGEQLLKIRVEPLFFEAEKSTLNNTQDTFLKQLTALMKDRKDSQLKACGIASYLDLGLEKPPISIDRITEEAANRLAQKRSDILKDYLVKEGIDSSRIFLCSPEIDLSTSSQPRVELNF